MKRPPSLARANTLREFGDPAFRARRQREHDRVAAADAECRVDKLLTAKCFQPNLIRELASRQRYPLAIKALKREAKVDDSAFITLHEPVAARVAAFRAARTFGAIKRDDEAQPMTLEILRDMKSEEAVCALASLGEMDWPKASRRCRAVFCLRAVIGARR